MRKFFKFLIIIAVSLLFIISISFTPVVAYKFIGNSDDDSEDDECDDYDGSDFDDLFN